MLYLNTYYWTHEVSQGFENAGDFMRLQQFATTLGVRLAQTKVTE